MRKKVVHILEEEAKTSVSIYKYGKILENLESSNFFNTPLLKSIKVDASQLADISHQVQHFLEKQFGKDSAKPRAITKFPISVFQDFEANGALTVIMKECLNFQSKLKSRTFDLMPPHTQPFIETLKTIQTILISKGHISVPTVFLRDVPIESVVLLKKIIVSHGGSISENIDTATHVVDWYEDVDSLPEEITEEFVRPLELQKDGRVRVHWLYHPDSYDEIIPREEVDVEDSVGQLCGAISVPKKEKWHVACRFITDCEMFNEWGNELDYEIEEKLEVEEKQEMETGKGRGGRRKSRKRSSTTPSGALLVEEKVQFTDSLMADTMPTTLRAAVATVTDLSGEVAKTSRENRSSSNPSDSVTSKKRKVNDRERFADLSSVSSINWFIEDKVSEYERQHLYFLRARDETTETEYLHIRRQLIELSNQISPAYLSSTDARRKIAGDVNKIFEAHSFLDGTGHINKSVNPYSRPSKYVTGAESVPHNAAKDSIKVPQVRKELESKLDNYIATRLDCLNKKVQMVIDAEKYVDTALETLAMEQRDIQLMQARTIFQKTQEQI